MIIFKNISKKIIGIGNAVVMPDESLELDDSFAELPAVKGFVRLEKATITRVEPPKPVTKPEKKVVVEEPEEEPTEENVEEPAIEEAPVEEAKPKRRTKKTKATEEEDTKAVEEELAAKIFG